MKQFFNYNKIAFLLMFSLLGTSIFAQDYPMSNTTITDCSGFFTDSGGNGMYSPNENFTMTFCPDLTTGTHVQLVFSGTVLAAGDVLCFFDGPDATAPALGCNTDFEPGAAFNVQATAVNTGGCLTITFNSDATGEGSGWEADINCIPSCQLIQSVIVSSDPPIMPADTGYIDICPGDRVFLEGMGLYPQAGEIYPQSDFTSTFEWDFGDGIQGVGPSVAHTYEEPGGYIIQLTITDTQGCQNTNYVSQRVRVSPYPVYETGDALPEEICQGDTIALNAVIANVDENVNVSVNAGTSGFQTGQIRSDSLALPDGTGAVYETPLSFTNFSPGQILTNVNDIVSICVNMEHSYLRDLEIRLRCPDGTEIILHDHPGNIGGGVFLGEPIDGDGNPPIPGAGYEYCWTPNAPNPTWINYVNTNPVGTLPAGDYSSFENLDNFVGCPLNGDWTILVEDLWGADNGFIFSWGITFASDLYPSIETFSPTFTDWSWQDNPSVFFETPDSIAAVPNAGTASYTFQTENDFGCNFDTTFALTVLPPTHPDCFSCEEQLIPPSDQTICAGESVDFSVAATVDSENPITFETVPNYPLGKPNHPPANAYFSEIAVNSVIPTMINDPLIDIVSICVDFDTDWDSDIQMSLVSPTGEQLELSTNNGGSGDNYTNTCFTPTAVTSITDGAPPFTGDFIPEGDWTILANEPINGIWSLKISDSNGNTKMGLLKSWNITFRSTNEVIYSWSPPTDLSCFICPDPTATPSQTITYDVSSVSSYGCVADDEVTLTVVQEIPAPVPNCEPNDDGTITVSWAQIPGITDYEINIAGAGFETVSELEYIIPGPFAPGDQVTFDIQSIFTGGNCGILTNTETCTYILNCDMYISTADGSTTGSVNCFGSCEGVISVSAFDASSTILGYTILNTMTGETSTQTGGGQFTGLCAGAYTFTAEDANGCTDTFDYVLTEPDEIEITIAEVVDVSCNGGGNGTATITAIGGNSNYSYLWDDPLAQTTATATFLSAGIYNPVVSDPLGCSQTIQVIVAEPEPLAANIVISNIPCFGDETGSITVVAMGGTSPYTLDWAGGDGTGLPAGQHTVTITDALGCDLVVTEMINQPAAPLTVEVTQSFVSCFGTSESSAIATPAGGTGTYSYEWDNGNLVEEGTNLTALVHIVTITDQNACTVEGQITITELDELIANVIPEPTSCSGSGDGAAAVNFTTGGVGTLLEDLTFVWSNGGNSQAIEDVAGGQISVTVTDAQGCEGIGETFIETPETITIALESASPLCFEGTDGTATVAEVFNGTGNVTYTWDAAAGNQTTETATNLVAGTYSVTVSDGGDCTTESTVEVLEPEPIAIDFTTVDNECFSDQDGVINSIVTGGTGSYAYLWSTDSTTQNITDLTHDTYYLTVVDGNNCMANDSAMVNSPFPIEADIAVDDVDCFGERNGQIEITTIGGTSPFLYSLDGVTFSGSSVQIGLTAGEYDVYIQDANGCVQTFEADVNEPPMIDLAVGARGDTIWDRGEVLLTLGDSLQLFGLSFNNQGPGAFQWVQPYEGTLRDSLTSSNNVAWTNAQNTIDYSLIVRDSLGCTAEMIFRVRVIKERLVLVPTGFSPNSDANNDLLLVHGQEGVKINLFRIYDRWGELLYETAVPFDTNATDIGWDGTFRGRDMPAGIYVWYLEAEYIDGNKESYKGNTTLIR